MIRSRAWRVAQVANRFLGKYREPVWLVGDGRSGTTWAADLINHDRRYRQMFEPFHPLVSPLLSFEEPWAYASPSDRSPPIGHFARRVFKGAVFHRRVDRYGTGLRANGLLIKDIFGHLLLNWVDVQIPSVKKVLILRHPCAVAVSKEKIPEGKWMEDPGKFLLQDDLRETLLLPYLSLIGGAEGYFERQITIWCILHKVVFQQMKKGRIHLLFYEELCTDFESETARLFDYLGKPQVDHGENSRLLELRRTPSETSRTDSAIHAGIDMISGWKRSLDSSQAEKAFEIMSGFGLEGIYDEEGRPSRRVEEGLLQQAD